MLYSPTTSSDQSILTERSPLAILLLSSCAASPTPIVAGSRNVLLSFARDRLLLHAFFGTGTYGIIVKEAIEWKEMESWLPLQNLATKKNREGRNGFK